MADKSSIKISCIIPVYNEASRVAKVLDAVLGCSLLDEVIVVNDGSSDGSLEVLKGIKSEYEKGKKGERAGVMSPREGGRVDRSKFRLISLSKNRGKTHAVRVGLEKARNDYVMMIDSDLVGLSTADVEALARPVLEGRADVTMSLRKNSFKFFHKQGIDFVSGERVLKKSLFGDLSHLDKLPGFGLEVYLNKKMIEAEVRLVVVNWKNVITPRKSVKMGLIRGAWGDVKMDWHIVSVMGVAGVVKQFRAMKRLIVKPRADSL